MTWTYKKHGGRNRKSDPQGKQKLLLRYHELPQVTKVTIQKQGSIWRKLSFLKDLQTVFLSYSCPNITPNAIV
jgi:hypothetical protein